MTAVRNRFIALCLLSLPWMAGLSLANGVKSEPVVAIIIDDLGNRLRQG